VAAAEHIFDCPVQRPLRRCGSRRRRKRPGSICYLFMNTDGVSSLEWGDPKMLVQGGQQSRIALTPRVFFLVAAECLTYIVLSQPIDEIANLVGPFVE